MKIESFWYGLKPFSKCEKGSKNRIGYGFVDKRRSRYNKSQVRNAYRSIRKYGFDLSECWGLAYTIIRWMSDNFGGYWRMVGDPDEWGSYTLEGEPYDFTEHCNDNNWLEKHSGYYMTRDESFKKHLENFLTNNDDYTEEDRQKFREFVIPRLRVLAKIKRGWPKGEDFPEFEDWIREINNMADKFEQGTYSKYFIGYFFNLWD